jgi:AraC-like DNA-binding protein
LLDLTSVSSLAVSPDGRLWVGTSEGLFILDRGGKLTRYTENNAKLYGGVISDILFDRHGYGWLSGPKGMTLYSPRTRLLSNVDFPKGFFNSEIMRRGVQGHGGKLYFMASTEIYYTDTQMKQFGRLDLPDGLLEENNYCFADDMTGHYWLGTENGLFCTPYDGSTMLHLGYGEGIAGRQVNALGLDRRGHLWLATEGGLLEADPRMVARWQADTLHKVTLYDIYRGENPVPAGQESIINERRKLTLRWNLSAEKLALKLVGDDYARPQGRLYEYRVDGNRRWTVVRDGAEVTIRGLQLGTHELRVRKAGMAGSERLYTVTVVPSGWAVAELLLLVGGIVLLVMWLRYRRRTRALLDERSEIELALIEVEHEQQLSREEHELAEAPETRKYDRVRFDEAECEEIMVRVRKYMEEHKPYLDCDYKMSELADTLHLSPSKLSQVFNVYLKENYYEFINRYRLAEFKQMIANGEYRRYTLTALSERCGFRRSSFFSTFRKVEGMTPTEYLKKHDISI